MKGVKRGVLHFTHDAGDRTMKRVALIHQDGRMLRTYEIDFAGLKNEPAEHWYLERMSASGVKADIECPLFGTDENFRR